MADPGEGVVADGTIRTGARRDRVPAIFEPVMTDAVAFAGKSAAGKSAPASLYVYGSVANGTARGRRNHRRDRRALRQPDRALDRRSRSSVARQERRSSLAASDAVAA